MQLVVFISLALQTDNEKTQYTNREKKKKYTEIE